MSENLKKYRLNIAGAKITLDGLDEFIVAVITVIGIFVAFAPATWSKWIVVPVTFVIVLFLFGIRFYIRQVYKKIEADNNYLDEEVLLLKEYAHELESQKRIDAQNFRLISQIQGFVAALDYMLEYQARVLNNDNININKVREQLNTALQDIYNSLHNGFEDYQEKITLALYAYSPETGKFLDFISCKPDISKHQKGRIWDRRDDAHICYVARHPEHTEFIFNNINEELPHPSKFEEDDVSEYVSSISIPIYFPNHEIRCVLSVTSNYFARFDRHSTNAFKNHCNTILISYLTAIGKIIELVLNNRFPNNNILIWQAISEYKKCRPEELTSDLIKFVEEMPR